MHPVYKRMNSLLPIFIKLDGSPCLVIGGGTVAEQKIEQLLIAQTHITVIAPKLSVPIRKLASENRITIRNRPFRKGDSKGFALIFGTTDAPNINRKIYNEACHKNIPVNIADVPELCSFYLSSVHRDGDLCIAVSTNGKSPTLGKIIRNRIKDQFGPEYTKLLKKLGESRPSVFETASDYETRKKLFEAIVAKEMKLLDALSAQKNTPVVPHETSPRSKANKKTGTVLLVGAGPGDPELITVKGLKALQKADVVLYDYLIDKNLLAQTKAGAERIFVGKKYGKFRLDQNYINTLLISKAKEGKTVVRLKGGDPFVFGRGGEEAEALFEAGIEFEIVPGITAAVAASAYAGIPLTDRRYSSSFALIAGHKSKSGIRRAVNWKALATGIDTVAVYMGVSKIEEIVSTFMKNGRPPGTPVAIIQNSTFASQKTITGTLGTIIDRIRSDPLRAPALIIIGEVVRLQSKLRWFEIHAEKLEESVQSLESIGVA